MAEPVFINSFTDFGFKKILKKLFQVASYTALSKEDKEKYEESVKYYNDLKNSLDTAHQEGYLEAQARYEMELEEERKQKELVQQQMSDLNQQWIETIRNMRNLGLSPEQIAVATNRPLAEIEEILGR